ncbi:hypothetical protein AAT19DRAFT_12247 [Rhodotorula toruloides]|uniref:Uncharacterized protein n=1 Tax=Rhodotorula toruloides TaxID=5286 RepID=A0A2T0AFP0_RHOTO|nr:hypothetical protein AAT19DRAFT_12247 [Rhodotorula toruloides]
MRCTSLRSQPAVPAQTHARPAHTVAERMPYVDSHGRVHSTPPLLSRIFLALRNLWLALCLFVATLLNVSLLKSLNPTTELTLDSAEQPNATHADRPSSSLAERERRRRDAGSSRGGGGGLGRTTGARIGGLGGSLLALRLAAGTRLIFFPSSLAQVRL